MSSSRAPVRKSKRGGKKKQKQKPLHLNAQLRLEKPITLKTKQVYKSISFSKEPLDSKTPFKSTEPRRLIYPNTEKRKPKEIKFSGKFESGNIDSVYVRAKRAYEIHIIPDPIKITSWFFFKCENLLKGNYTFIITGFSRDTGIFHHDIKPVYLSMRDREEGKTWQKIGQNLNYWLSVSGSPAEYTLSFTFHVKRNDTFYFAFTYPYTYSNLLQFLQKMPSTFSFCTPAKSGSGIEMPIVFWDADHNKCATFTSNKASMPKGSKPLIIIVGRHHPVETNSSYAIEGFLECLFQTSNDLSKKLMAKYSILIIPMMNIDGVVCGLTRSGTNNVDLNRVWKNRSKSTEAQQIVHIVDELAKSRRVTLFLDFHGHTAKYNVFSIGVRNRKVAHNDLQGIFTRMMTKICPFYDFSQSSTIGPKLSEKTMRSNFHTRYNIPFAYTLEMSIAGTNKTEPCKQFTPADFRSIGKDVCTAISSLLVENVEIQSAFEERPRVPIKRVNSTLSFNNLKINSLYTQSIAGTSARKRRRGPNIIALSENVSEAEIVED